MKLYLDFSIASTALLTPTELILGSLSQPGDGHLVKAAVLRALISQRCPESAERH